MRFTEIRKSKGVTQQYLADRLGVKQSTVAMWETGKSVPSMKMLLKLSEFFEIEISVLVASFDKIRNE